MEFIDKFHQIMLNILQKNLTKKPIGNPSGSGALTNHKDFKFDFPLKANGSNSRLSKLILITVEVCWGGGGDCKNSFKDIKDIPLSIRIMPLSIMETLRLDC